MRYLLSLLFSILLAGECFAQLASNTVILNSGTNPPIPLVSTLTNAETISHAAATYATLANVAVVLNDVDAVQEDTMLLALEIAAHNDYAVMSGAQRITTTFEDTTGIDTNRSSGYTQQSGYLQSAAAILDTILLHCDGADGSTAFDDEKGIFTWTATKATNTTSIYKFGTASMALPDLSSYINAPYNASYILGTNDWTVDCWIYKTTTTADDNGGIFMVTETGGWPSGYALRLRHVTGTGAISPVVIYTDQNYDAALNSPVVTAGAWHHVAATAKAGVYRFFLDGTMYGAYTNATGVNNNGGAFRFGSGMVGFLDEARLLLGTAVWTNDFTPPASAYASSYSAITLVSKTNNFTSAYDTVRGMLVYQQVDVGITQNVDVIHSYSLDGGANWTALNETTNNPPLTVAGQTVWVSTNTAAIAGSNVLWKLETTPKHMRIYMQSGGLR